MAAITTRAVKGTPLTNAEVDANFTGLNDGKLEKSSNLSDLANAATARTNLGLGNVNNTSDANKPISTATQTALDTKAPLASPSFTGPSTITANSASSALTITQDGTGNVLTVNDVTGDMTPFVIDQNGNVGIGVSSPGALLDVSGGFVRNSRFGADPAYVSRRANGTSSSPTASANGESHILRFDYYDGASYISAAQIGAVVDGTPGTRSMPGRLVFSTTADGASSPTERMRIDNAGNVGIGGTPTTGYNFVVYKNLDVTYGAGVMSRSTVTSTCNDANLFYSYPSTQATTFTLGRLKHFIAALNSIGAGSSVTSQYGFLVENTLIGATNNYGFYGNIASGTGRYNLYMAGSADNYINGRVGIGSAPYGSASLTLSRQITGGATSIGIYSSGTIQSDVVSAAYSRTEITTAATAFTLSTAYGHFVKQGTIGAGSSITAQYAFMSGNDLFQAASNYGFYADDTGGANASTGKLNIGFRSALSAATGGGAAWNIYASGTAPNYMATTLHVGSMAQTLNYGVRAARNQSGATTFYQFSSEGTIQSDVTFAAYGYLSYPATAAAAFTLESMHHYTASLNVIGAGSSVTNQSGFRAESTLIGATNNYGFIGSIAAGTGQYNFYAAGSAQNLFSGDVLIFGAGGLGYTAGSGGVVTQATSKTTAVTLNKATGQITLNNASLAAGASATFIVNNTMATASDVVIANLVGGVSSSANYRVEVENINARLFRIRVTNISAGALGEAALINFAIIKGASA